jgi:hypothetical protein
VERVAIPWYMNNSWLMLRGGILKNPAEKLWKLVVNGVYGSCFHTFRHLFGCYYVWEISHEPKVQNNPLIYEQPSQYVGPIIVMYAYPINVYIYIAS